MKNTNAGTSYWDWKNNTCFSELWTQINGTNIQEEKINMLQNERSHINSSIKNLHQSYKPPNLIYIKKVQ